MSNFGNNVYRFSHAENFALAWFIENVQEVTREMGQGDKPTEVQQKATDPGKDDAANKLRQEAQQAEQRKVTDKADGKDASQPEKKTVDPYNNLQTAQAAANEIAMYFKRGMKDSDKIQVKYGDGQVKEVTVGDRVKELKTIVKNECEFAIGASDKIRQTSSKPGEASVASMIQDNNERRKALALELGMLPDKINMQEINERMAKAKGEEKTKFEQLHTLQGQREKLEAWKNAPSYTRTFYAMLKAEGVADPTSGIEKLADGRPKVNEKEVMDAYQLVREAGRLNPDFKSTRVFANADSHVSALYAMHQGDRTQRLIDNVLQSHEAGRQGNTAEQERLLKAAVDEANKVDLSLIAAQLRIKENQENEQVKTALTSILANANNAKLEMASFLKDKGRFAEAQQYFNDVKCDPVGAGLIYKGVDEKTKLPIYRDESMAQLDNALSAGIKLTPGAIDQTLQKYNDAMQRQDHNAAQAGVDQLYNTAAEMKKQVEEANRSLEQERVRLSEAKANLDKRTELDENAKQIEQLRIDAELQLINNTVTMRNASANRLYNQARLMDADLRLAKATPEYGSQSAHDIYEEVKRNDPELVKLLNDNVPKDEEGRNAMDQRLEASREKGWWERNWRAVATVGAVAAGVVVGALTIWSGPGAAVFGAGTTAALLTTMGVATAGGVIAGGLTYHGVHRGLTNDKSDFWGDFKEGGMIGGSTALLVSAAWAAPALIPAGGEAATAANATRFAALTGRVTNTARTLGMTKGTLALGYGSQALIETGEVVFNDKSITDAATSLAWKGGVNSMMFGLPGKMAGAGGAMGRGSAEASRAVVGFAKYKAFEEGLFTGLHSLYGAPVMGADGRNPGESTFLNPPSVVTMVGSDAYQAYSPVQLPGYGRPRHKGLDLGNAKDEEEFWRKLNTLYPGMDVLPQKRVEPYVPTKPEQK